MATVAELIEYLQTLPQEASVDVAVAVEGNWSSYTSKEALELPTRNEDGLYSECSDNLDFTRLSSGESFVFFGRT